MHVSQPCRSRPTDATADGETFADLIGDSAKWSCGVTDFSARAATTSAEFIEN